jgi:uncharacterized protein with von Willebrand factor type A (vWA) domain
MRGRRILIAAAAVLSLAFAATAQARTYVQLSFDLRTSAGEGSRSPAATARWR